MATTLREIRFKRLLQVATNIEVIPYTVRSTGEEKVRLSWEFNNSNDIDIHTAFCQKGTTFKELADSDALVRLVDFEDGKPACWLVQERYTPEAKEGEEARKTMSWAEYLGLGDFNEGNEQGQEGI